MDNINILARGMTTNSRRISEEVLDYRKSIGDKLFKWCEITHDSPSHIMANKDDKKVILFVAASQHYNFLKKLGGTDFADTIMPTNTIWDIVGYYHYYRCVVNHKIKHWWHYIKDQVVKEIMKESGVIPRTMAYGFSAGLNAVEGITDASFADRRRIFKTISETIDAKIETGVAARYDEVFQNFYGFRELDERNHLVTKNVQIAELQKLHNQFAKTSLQFLRSAVFKLKNEMTAYFDTGLVIKHVMFPTSYGFMSNSFKRVFGRIVCAQQKRWAGIIEIGSTDSLKFEEAIEDGLTYRGLMTEGIIDYEDGIQKSQALVPALPASCVYPVTFHMRRIGKGKNTMTMMNFASQEHEDDFEVWMKSENTISYSVVFTTRREGSMPGLDHVVFVKEMSATREAIHIYGMQDSLERNNSNVSSISNDRFKLLETLKVRVLNIIVQRVWPERKIALTNQHPKLLQVQDKDNKVVPGFTVELIYICLRESCHRGNNDKADRPRVWVMTRKACLDNFGVMPK